MGKKYSVEVTVQTQYIEEQSDPEQSLYIFSYTITITNTGSVGAKLLKRHWIITDANGQVQEVRGEGVVGEQPHLKPGESHIYTSGTHFRTEVGNMIGTYLMEADDGTRFDAEIPRFTCYVPGQLH